MLYEVIPNAVAVGDVSVSTNPRSAQDVLGHAFVDMQAYLQEAATAAARIAEGDLTVESNAPTGDSYNFV